MHILFLGNSKLVNKRLLPMLPSLPQISRVSVARFSAKPWASAAEALVHVRYDTFDDAERGCTPDLVYVSTVNSAHYEWAARWLERGCHVIVDKPATLRLADTQSLVALAEQKGVLLAEATVYTYHPQVALLRSVFSPEGPRQATVQFAFPPLDAGNFRYRAELGGGAVFDTAAYAASVGRVFFGTLPSKVVAACGGRAADGLCLAYSTLMEYPDGQTMVGHFGFHSEYVNRLHLASSHAAAHVNRIFTTPADVQNQIHVQRRNEDASIAAPPADAFRCFFEAVLMAISQRDFRTFADAMLYDAKVTEQLQLMQS